VLVIDLFLFIYGHCTRNIFFSASFQKQCVNLDHKSISSGWCKFGRVYLHIHVHIHLVKLYTSQFFSGTCKLGRVYSNGYIFKQLYFQRLYFQTAIFSTAIFPTAIFLIYINHRYHFSFSTLLAVTSLLT
jgi:hypothetical protein